jgi:hypothetical protein
MLVYIKKLKHLVTDGASLPQKAKNQLVGSG